MHMLSQNEEFKQEVAEFLKPVTIMVYNEIYIYVWFICLYSVLLMFISLGNMFILLKLGSHVCKRMKGDEHEMMVMDG